MSAASAGASAYGQSQAAGAEADYQNNQYSATAQASLEAYRRTIKQSADQVNQEAANSSDQALQLRAAAGQARGSVSTSAAERGVTGDSVETLLGDFSRIESTNSFNLETNLGWFKGQIAENLAGVRAGGQSRISGAAPRPIQGPNILGSVLGFGSSALGSYDTYARQTKSGPYR